MFSSLCVFIVLIICGNTWINSSHANILDLDSNTKTSSNKEQTTESRLQQIAKQFQQQSQVKANFIQKKQIKGLQKPLISSGYLLVDQKLGIIFKQEKPFSMLIKLTETNIYQQVNQNPPQVITAKENPQVFEFNHLLRSLIESDFSVLQNSFNIELTQNQKEIWSISFYPINAPLNKIFKQIDMSGSQFLNNITIYDQQGDITSLEFSAQQDYLSKEDTKLFVNEGTIQK